MKEIFSADNHDNANTFLLIVIYLTLFACFLFVFYRRVLASSSIRNNERNNQQNNQYSSTGFISF